MKRHSLDWDMDKPGTPQFELEHIHRGLEHIDQAVAAGRKLHDEYDLEALFRGPLADSMTHVERFVEFIDKLASIEDGEGSLLDNSMFLYGSNMSNSDRHNNYPLPTLLVGGGAGTLTGGQHIDLPERTTLSNLHLTVVNKAGLELKAISDSTGEIAGV